MIKYYYIPKVHEDLIKMLQTSWLLQSEKAYTIITGLYNSSEVDYLGETVDTNVLDQRRKPIARTFYFEEEDGYTRAELFGFCLEANSKDVPLNLPPDVIVFNTNTDFLKYIHE